MEVLVFHWIKSKMIALNSAPRRAAAAPTRRVKIPSKNNPHMELPKSPRTSIKDSHGDLISALANNNDNAVPSIPKKTVQIRAKLR